MRTEHILGCVNFGPAVHIELFDLSRLRGDDVIKTRQRHLAQAPLGFILDAFSLPASEVELFEDLHREIGLYVYDLYEKATTAEGMAPIPKQSLVVIGEKLWSVVDFMGYAGALPEHTATTRYYRVDTPTDSYIMELRLIDVTIEPYLLKQLAFMPVRDVTGALAINCALKQAV